MSFTFFCNQCKRFASDGKRKYYAANCMHVFCETCLPDKDFCKLCAKPCVSMQISREMPSEVRAFFEPNSFQKISGHLQKIWSFQNSQNLLFHQQNNSKKRYEKVKEEFFKMQKELKEEEHTLQQENAIIAKLKAAYASGNVPDELLTMSPTKMRANSSSRSKGSGNESTSPASTMFRSSSISSSASHRSSVDSRRTSGYVSNTFASTPRSFGSTTLGADPSHHGASSSHHGNMKRLSPNASLPKSQQGQQKAPREKTSIIHQTLLNMQKVSQDKYEAQRREQMRKMDWK